MTEERRKKLREAAEIYAAAEAVGNYRKRQKAEREGITALRSGERTGIVADAERFFRGEITEETVETTETSLKYDIFGAEVSAAAVELCVLIPLLAVLFTMIVRKAVRAHKRKDTGAEDIPSAKAEETAMPEFSDAEPKKEKGKRKVFKRVLCAALAMFVLVGVFFVGTRYPAAQQQAKEHKQATVTRERGIVYVTPNGEKYHLADCQYIDKSTARALNVRNARMQGYAPCKVCNPDDY